MKELLLQVDVLWFDPVDLTVSLFYEVSNEATISSLLF